jgi:iron complex outermembrane recepter protein
VDGDGNPIVELRDPQAPKGTPLPVTPKLKANVIARYEFPLAAFDSFVQGSVIYSDERESDLRLVEREIIGVLPSYTVTDFSAGIGKDSWAVEMYVSNAFDERAEVSRFSQCAEAVCGAQTYIVPQMPRMFGVKFRQQF